MNKPLLTTLFIASTSVLAIASDDCLQKCRENRWVGLEASMTVSSKGANWYGETLTEGDPGLETNLNYNRDLTDNFGVGTRFRGASSVRGTEYEVSGGASYKIGDLSLTVSLSEQSNTDAEVETDWIEVEFTYSMGSDLGYTAWYTHTDNYDGSDADTDIWSLRASYAMGAITVSADYEDYSYDSTDLVDYSNTSFGIKYVIAPGLHIWLEQDSKIYNSTTETTGSWTNVGLSFSF